MTGVVRWLRSRDAGLAATRRAFRAAIVIPGLFAFGVEVLDLPAFSTFAAFGGFATLVFVGYSGSISERIQAQVALGVAGAVLVSLATLVSRTVWLGVVAMLVVGFAVLFAGAVSSVLASSSTSLLLAFVLPVTLPGSPSAVGERLAGWTFAALISVGAIAVLWPQPARDPLRMAVVRAARALGQRFDAEVAFGLGPVDASPAERDAAIATSHDAISAMHSSFYGVPYRPTGLNTSARTVVRLVDELDWLNAIANQTGGAVHPSQPKPQVCAVKQAAATVMTHGADLLDRTSSVADGLGDDLDTLHEATAAMQRTVVRELPLPPRTDSLEPNFRAQEVSYAVSVIAANIELTIAAERRSWWQRLLGRQPAGVVGSVSAAGQRASAHLDRHSVWLHNSVRGAIGLAAAVGVAEELGVQHSFWAVLGTLSVLRSNALSTGQNIVRSLLGTVGGFVAGGLITYAVGDNTMALWILLPFATLLAGLAPAAISFAAGQASFTLTVMILFNITDPIGWKVGLVRIEDVALGCAVSLVVGLLFWPRGASSALGEALAEAYSAAAGYLRSAIEFGTIRGDGQLAPVPRPEYQREQAAGAARRLDDAFREFLAERGSKRLGLADATTLVTGVAGLRLSADAVLDLWDHEDGAAAGDRSPARQELDATGERIADWYDTLAGALAGGGTVPEPLERDPAADARLLEATRRGTGADGAGATAIRLIWSGDHLDAARRLQAALVEPARAAVGQTQLHLSRQPTRPNRYI